MKSLYLFSYLLCLIIMSSQAISAQIVVLNPSFEDTPTDATVPHGWHKCNPTTTPDILPGFWGVYTEPEDGESYIGIITRSDGSFETIGQRLSTSCKKNQCYQATINLAHSKSYTGFNKTIRLRIYLGYSKCDLDQLIFESPQINHIDWKKYSIEFTPKEDYDYIILKAYHPKSKEPVKANILIDNLSSIEICPKA